MAAELELKAVVADPEALETRLLAAGAEPSFRGAMHDRRYDRGGELAARDEVLRVRTYENPGLPPRVVLGWKGPTGRSPEGYKQREEYECQCTGASPETILLKLGFAPVHMMDRAIAQFALADTIVRIEHYPRMDVLVEIEGAPAAIEAAIALSGIPREQFSPEPLAAFVARYEARTGQRAILQDASQGAGS
jgi:adenylate cyclase class IV